MAALINSTKEVSGNLPNNLDKGIIALLKQKIEDCIIGCKSIVISISTPLMNCLNTIKVDAFEITEDNLYLNNKNFEIHINFDNTTNITYEDEYDEYFSIVINNTEINLYFI